MPFFAFSHLRLWYTKLEKILILGNLVFSKTFLKTGCHHKNNEPSFEVSANGLKNLIEQAFSIVSPVAFFFFFKKKEVAIIKSLAYKTQKIVLFNPSYTKHSDHNREGRLWTRFLECKDKGQETYISETGIGPDS